MNSIIIGIIVENEELFDDINELSKYYMDSILATDTEFELHKRLSELKIFLENIIKYNNEGVTND